LKEGDHVNIEGPYGKFGYEAGGNIILCKFNFYTEGKKQIFKRIFFIAGGSGITPCYQVIR
jgi:ferredoxin-NADP reductase